MTPTNDAAEIAARLTEAQRNVASALLGNAWEGVKPTPGILILNGLGLMRIDVLKGRDGEIRRFKAKPTPLGVAVRAHLAKTED